MLFRQLEYFVALAREQHFARAAAACYVSQPALSSAISKLETELNVSLIFRDHSFQGLTDEGERLVIWAKRILIEHDAFKMEVRTEQAGLRGTLRLGVIPSASTTVALSVEAFLAEHPLARVKITSRLPSAELSRQLHNFEIDAAIAYYQPHEESGFDVIPLYEERYVLVVPRRLMPHEDSFVTWREASRLPLAMLTSEMHSRQVIDAALDADGVIINPQIETDSVASLYAHVDTGRWASIVPYSWINSFRDSPETRMVPLTSPTATAEVAVAINATQPGSRIARAFATTAARLSLRDLFERDTPLLQDQRIAS